MSQTEVLSAAMRLTEKEKSDVIVELLDSLHSEQLETSDEDLLSEANDREAMMDSDPENEISHEELLANFEHLRKK